MNTIELFYWVQSLRARGMELTPNHEAGTLTVRPKELITELDRLAARMWKALILEKRFRSMQEITLWTGWYFDARLGALCVAQGALYPQRTGPLSGKEEWVGSLRVRGIRLSRGPMRTVALAPEGAVTGRDVVAAGAYGFT